jgi:hypothetical protein
LQETQNFIVNPVVEQFEPIEEYKKEEPKKSVLTGIFNKIKNVVIGSEK